MRNQYFYKTAGKAEVINAYDNTIIYTDYFLGKVVDYLEKQATPCAISHDVCG